LKYKKLIWFIGLILLVSNVMAIGIAPSRSTFDYKQGMQESRFRVIVDEIPSKVIFTPEGELADYIELEKDVLIAEQAETWINFKLTLPEDLAPGERRGGILALAVPKDTYKENIVMATTAIIHQVRVNVPYPGKYAIGKMYINNLELETPVTFTLALANYGKQKINNAKATIVIKGPTNEEIGVLNTDSTSIEPSKEDKLTVQWDAEHPGKYFAEATIEYDNKILKISQNFEVGDLKLEIERIQVNNFKIGQIAKLDIYLRNKWNTPLNVDGHVEIYKDNKLVSSFNSVPVEIQEQSTAIMDAYWNTEGVEVGEYDVSVKTNYDGKASEKTFSSIVSIDNIQFNELVSAKVVTDKGGSRTTLLIVAVMVLIILNIMLFVYISKKLKSRPPSQPPQQQYQN